MRIVHLSYAQVNDCADPHAWSKKLSFYVGILEAMTKYGLVKSVHCISYTGVFTKNDVEYHFLKKKKWQLWFPFSLHTYLKKLKPDAIIVHGLRFPWQVVLLRWQVGNDVKILNQHHAEKPYSDLRLYLQRLADQKIDGYFFTSYDHAIPWIKRRLIKSFSKIHPVMEVSSPFYRIDVPEAQQKTLLKKGAKNYLWIGRLDKNKDPVTLVRAFINFLNIETESMLYIIFQENELLPQLRQLLESHPTKNGNIILVGKVNHDDLLYWYNSVNFVISTSHYEGSGIAVCEAMSCGCIPIVSDIASFRMMTNDGRCGLLFRPGSHEELAERLIESCLLNISSYQTKVLHQFRTNLSFDAIGTKMHQVIA